MEVGSILPSSTNLTKTMFKDVTRDDLRTVVELGPGLGGFTSYVDSLIGVEGRLILVEVNPRFRSELEIRYPRATIIPRFEAIDDDLYGTVDFVVCGLPFTSIPLSISRDTIDLSANLLVKGGRFVTFLYAYTYPLPKNQQLLRHIRQRFSTTDTRACIANLPPAIVIDCEK